MGIQDNMEGMPILFWLPSGNLTNTMLQLFELIIFNSKLLNYQRLTTILGVKPSNICGRMGMYKQYIYIYLHMYLYYHMLMLTTLGYIMSFVSEIITMNRQLSQLGTTGDSDTQGIHDGIHDDSTYEWVTTGWHYGHPPRLTSHPPFGPICTGCLISSSFVG